MINSKEEFRKWLEANHDKEKEVYLDLKRGKPTDPNIFYYLDAVEVALCFGWIDSTLKRVDGKLLQRFSPRRKNSSWNELNKARVIRLIKLGLMTEAGLKVVPKDNFKMDNEILSILKKEKLDSVFFSFPELYRRIRISYLTGLKSKSKEEYLKALDRFISFTKENKMYGQWNDYGRLIEKP